MLKRFLLLLLIGLSGLVIAEPGAEPGKAPTFRLGGSPIFPEGESDSRYPSARSPFTRFLLNGPERFSSEPMGKPTDLEAQVRMVNWEIGRGLDIIAGLGLHRGTTAASVSTRCQNGAMAKAAWSFQNVYRFNHVGRHDSLDSLATSLLKLPKGYETYIIAEHGNVGFAGQLTLERAPEIGAAIKRAGLKRVVLVSCFTAHGEEGKAMIASLAYHSGAAIYAWDKTVYPDYRTTTLSEVGNLVIAIYDAGEGRPRREALHALELPK